MKYKFHDINKIIIMIAELRIQILTHRKSEQNIFINKFLIIIDQCSAQTKNLIIFGQTWFIKNCLQITLLEQLSKVVT